MIRLYSGPLCIHSHRIRLVLAEKGVEAERVAVDPDEPPAALMEHNPYGTVPTLVDRDVALYDPTIVTEYLDERYPHPPLMPVDPVSRAKSRLVVYRMERDWYALYEKLETAEPRHAQAARRALQESLVAAAELFEGQPYFLNDDFSIMDAVVLPLLWRLPAAGITLPRAAEGIAGYAARLFATQQFQDSLTREERALRE